MAPKSKARISEADEYDSDERATTKDDAEQPKRKKARVEKKSKSSNTTATVPGGGARDEDGSEYWELSKNRRVTISEYRGKRMIHIREYYSKDDKMLPGKKGISLPIEQLSALITTLPHIEMVLKGHGEEIPRPVYEEGQSKLSDSRDDAKMDTAMAEEEQKKKSKKNFEATSDEEGLDD